MVAARLPEIATVHSGGMALKQWYITLHPIKKSINFKYPVCRGEPIVTITAMAPVGRLKMWWVSASTSLLAI